VINLKFKIEMDNFICDSNNIDVLVSSLVSNQPGYNENQMNGSMNLVNNNSTTMMYNLPSDLANNNLNIFQNQQANVIPTNLIDNLPSNLANSMTNIKVINGPYNVESNANYNQLNCTNANQNMSSHNYNFKQLNYQNANFNQTFNSNFNLNNSRYGAHNYMNNNNPRPHINSAMDCYVKSKRPIQQKSAFNKTLEAAMTSFNRTHQNHSSNNMNFNRPLQPNNNQQCGYNNYTAAGALNYNHSHQMNQNNMNRSNFQQMSNYVNQNYQNQNCYSNSNNYQMNRNQQVPNNQMPHLRSIRASKSKVSSKLSPEFNINSLIEQCVEHLVLLRKERIELNYKLAGNECIVDELTSSFDQFATVDEVIDFALDEYHELEEMTKENAVL